MRNFFVAAMLLPSLLFISCQKESVNLADQISTGDGILSQLKEGRARQANFQLLSFAIARAGLTNELNDPNFAYTLFAPTDEAFAAIGLDSRAAINGVPVETLRGILLYHVLASKVLAAQVPSTSTELTMLSNQKAYIESSAAGVFINGVQVVSADISSKSGVIHAVNRVLLPPAGNIVDVVAGDDRFTFLVAAVLKADLAGALSGAGPLTVFAPTNEAFIAAGFTTIEAVEAATAEELIPILTYHVVGGRAFSSDLSDGQVLEMLSGLTTTISLSGGAQIDGNKSDPSNIIQTDIMATNGVVHVIDGVLLP